MDPRPTGTLMKCISGYVRRGKDPLAWTLTSREFIINNIDDVADGDQNNSSYGYGEGGDHHHVDNYNDIHLSVPSRHAFILSACTRLSFAVLHNGFEGRHGTKKPLAFMIWPEFRRSGITLLPRFACSLQAAPLKGTFDTHFLALY